VLLAALAIRARRDAGALVGHGLAVAIGRLVVVPTANARHQSLVIAIQFLPDVRSLLPWHVRLVVAW
jgi:hypothetical protein